MRLSQEKELKKLFHPWDIFILAVNIEKHNKPNYIGPNVLMEMSKAFYLSKPIYILNGVPHDSPLIDKILGLEPIFLRGDIAKLSISVQFGSHLVVGADTRTLLTETVSLCDIYG